MLNTNVDHDFLIKPCVCFFLFGGNTGVAEVPWTDEPICKAKMEAKTWRTNVCTPRGKEGGISGEIGTDIYTTRYKILMGTYSIVQGIKKEDTICL